jgi:hypothetical protein
MASHNGGNRDAMQGVNGAGLGSAASDRYKRFLPWAPCMPHPKFRKIPQHVFNIMHRLEETLSALQSESSSNRLDGLETVREYVIGSNGLPQGWNVHATALCMHPWCPPIAWMQATTFTSAYTQKKINFHRALVKISSWEFFCIESLTAACRHVLIHFWSTPMIPAIRLHGYNAFLNQAYISKWDVYMRGIKMTQWHH